MLEFSHVTSGSAGGLQNVDLRIQQGDIHTITVVDTETLEECFQLLTRRKAPLEGRIALDGTPYEAVDSIEFASADCEHVIHELTVAQNVVGLTQKKGGIYRRRAAERTCQELIDQFAFSLRAGETLQHASAEDIRITELLRCYVRQPKVLILNELLNVFSVRNIIKVKELLLHMHLSGTYIVYLTRKLDDVFNLGDAVTVLREGVVVDTFRKQEVLAHPNQFYRALLGGSSIFPDEQFAADSENFDILDVIRIGTQCIFAQETTGNALCKYAHLTEQYFHDTRCVIYLVNTDGTSFSPYFAFEHQKDEIPFTDTQTLLHFFHQKDFLSISPMEPCVHTPARGFQGGTFLYARIEAGSETAGLLQVAFPSRHTITKKDMDYLHITCDEIAMLFKNTRLIGRSALMQEGHHRIKNNLQLIISMLLLYKMQFQKSGKETYQLEDMEHLIDTTVRRVQSIAAIHDLLSRSSVLDDLITFRSILGELRRFYQNLIQINVDLQSAPVISHAKATSFALVLNEMIANSVKHNPDVPNLCCWIDIDTRDGTVILNYRDNGRGFPEGESGTGTGIGSLLIRSIVHAELGGTIENFNGNGACTRICFSVSGIY